MDTQRRIKKSSPIWYTLLIFFIMSFVVVPSVFAFSFGSTTPVNAYSLPVNYETDVFDGDGDLQYTTSIPFTSKSIITCDIYNDGQNEFISWTDSTITIIRHEPTGLVSNFSFSVPTISANNQVINFVSCNPMVGNGYYTTSGVVYSDATVLHIHRGTVDGESEVVTIEYNPPYKHLIVQHDEEYSLGGNFYVTGYIDDVPATVGTGVSCTEYTGTLEHRKGKYVCMWHDNSRFTFYQSTIFQGDKLESTNPLYRFPYRNDADTRLTGNVISSHSFNSYRTNGVLTMQGENNFYYYYLATEWDSRKLYRLTYDGITSSVSLLLTAPNANWNFNVFKADLNGDGQVQPCYGGQWHSGTRAQVRCWTTDGSSVVYSFSGGTDFEVASPMTFYDYRLMGTNTPIFSHQHQQSITQVRQRSEFTAFATITTSMPTQFLISSMVRHKTESNTFLHLHANRLGILEYINASNITYTNDVNGFPANSRTVFVSLTPNYDAQLVVWESGNTGTIYSNTALDIDNTITLKNPNVYAGGYYGFAPESCTGNITIKAKECTDSSPCTYTATQPLSVEQVCTTCGGTVAEFCGSPSFAQPEVTCEFLSTGTKNIDVWINSTSMPDVKQARKEFSVIVSNSASCGEHILTSPSTQVVDESGQPITPPTIDGELSPDGAFETLRHTIVGNMPTTLRFIFAMMIILGLTVYLNRESRGNHTITLIGALIGSGIAVILGLLAIEIVIIVVIFYMIATFVTMYLGKATTGGV